MFNTIGDKISLIRKDLGMTQQEMAEKIGMSRSSLVKIENSQRVISLHEGNAISKLLGISLETLLTEEKGDIVTQNFVKAFKSKGMTSNDINEIAKCELLFDAFVTQEQIYRGE
ncbi:MAG: helix-turn-helix transcriptional regulator [Clostridia bacterium]|nr:helix-turn-helix transcriptional regulator [Clostridia bacterium]MDD4048318.1 helix-turn-helix transcriptional regulator [Clostridia bacterium]